MNTATTTYQTYEEQQEAILTSKILELQSALFFTESSSLVKLPTHVVSDIEIDSEGQIWFVVPRPVQHLDAFDKKIAAKMDFFKKGTEFFVKVKGVAEIVMDSSEYKAHPELSDVMKERMMDSKVIVIKVSVAERTLIDNSPKPAQKSWFQASRSQLSSWFF
jgi:hypothetical protein